MAVLNIVEQALRTGNPLPEMLPTPLFVRCHGYRQQSGQQLVCDGFRDLDDNYRRFCVAVGSYLNFLSAIDDLVLLMKGALGESHFISRDLSRRL
ncbi:hypothetical protein BJY01DRAFT_208445 [Aspergillus pseudoustus]|uniref:DUF2421 domain-containing protein n=1 Tax=Aspergillus pseudoustus TaxID=1810923 RepID=A0ABR4KIK9_9EURO